MNRRRRRDNALSVETAKATPVKKATGEWTETKLRFLQLEPVRLRELNRSIMTVPINRRPYLSNLAKAEGRTYTTITLADGENMLVLRYEM